MDFRKLMECYHLSEADNNQNVYNRLASMMKKQNITPVIGAGLSCWAYPLWGALLRKEADSHGIKDEIESLLSHNKYEESASRLEEEITHNGFTRLLEYTFDESKIEENVSKMPAYLKKIPRLFHGPVVTTNFDRVIEYLYRLEGQNVPDVVNPSDDFQSDKIKRALHENSQLIVKMHGDMKDSKHLVLTREAYDHTYGEKEDDPDLTKPMPRFLKTILQRNPLLFLGCSLQADRTCSVIKKCAENIQQFAFLELPEDTINEKDEWHPILKEGVNQEGRLKEGLKKRIRSVTGEMNIQPIWYPHGKHDEALDAFFSQLLEDTASKAEQHAVSEDDSDYVPLHLLLGREEQVSEIVCALAGTDSCCVWVEGPAGIGKTETCKAVYHRMKSSYPGRCWMPYVKITGADTLPAFWDAVARAAGLDMIENVPSEDYPEYLINRLKNMAVFPRGKEGIRILYLDNWEDIWYGVERDEAERTVLLRWMRELNRAGFRLLISTREMAPSNLNNREFHLQPLDETALGKEEIDETAFNELDSVKLFCSILGREIAPREKEDFRRLICQLEGHPLAIVLTATQARREIEIKDVLARWDQAKQDPAAAGKTHESLEIALRVSWNSVSENQEAVFIWGLLYYSVKDIPAAVFERLRGEVEEERWREGVSALIDANLLNVSRDREKVSMLLPLKKQYIKFVPEDDPMHRRCLIMWAECINHLLETAGDLKSEERPSLHPIVIEILPQIYHIIVLIISRPGEDKAVENLNRMVKRGRNYFRNYLQSTEILERLITFYASYKNTRESILPMLNKIYGDLLRRQGELEEAEKRYSEAERLYKKKQDDLGLANTLKSRGDLLRRQGELEKAEEKYREAEELYRKERAALGLANTLKSQGDLLRRQGKLEEAGKKYREAEELYKREQANLGIANTLKSQGDLLRRQGKLEEVEKKYKEAETLYKKVQDNLGLANMLKSQGDLLMRQWKLGEAEKKYEKSEELYRKLKANLGLANTFRSQGEYLKRRGKLEEAEEKYEGAEELYKKIGANLGLANTFLCRGDLLSLRGNLGEAKDKYEETEKLYKKEQDNLGLANTFLAEGDLLRRQGKLEEAEKKYGEAERLYKKVQDNLGLTNTLQSRGDLLLRREQLEEAEKKYEEAEGLYKKQQDLEGYLLVLFKLRKCYKETGNPRISQMESLVQNKIDEIPYKEIEWYIHLKMGMDFEY